MPSQTKPWLWARHSCFLLTIVLLTAALPACYSTEGVLIKDMDSEDPYQFSCEASRSECLEDMKRSLIGSGFDVQEEDMDAGVFVVSKTLNKKEKVSTSGFTELAAGTESTGQSGKLTFLFTKEEQSISVEMSGEVSIEVTEDKGNTTTTETQTSTAIRGHPLMVRYGLMLDSSKHLTLESPSRKEIQEAR